MKTEILAKATAELAEEIKKELEDKNEEENVDELTIICERRGIQCGCCQDNEGDEEEVQS